MGWFMMKERRRRGVVDDGVDEIVWGGGNYVLNLIVNQILHFILNHLRNHRQPSSRLSVSRLSA